jgi:hypothetical protein
MFSNAQIFEAARTLRPLLSEVVSDVKLVPQIDIQLAQLLTQPDLEEDTRADLILEVLENNTETRTWLQHFLDPQRSFNPLPGNPALQSATKYVCPIANDYTWYREDTSPIPVCPTHLVPLVPAQS